jgi:hypothetical protein
VKTEQRLDAQWQRLDAQWQLLDEQWHCHDGKCKLLEHHLHRPKPKPAIHLYPPSISRPKHPIFHYKQAICFSNMQFSITIMQFFMPDCRHRQVQHETFHDKHAICFFNMRFSITNMQFFMFNMKLSISNVQFATSTGNFPLQT